jgi:hypothetical protein
MIEAATATIAKKIAAAIQLAASTAFSYCPIGIAATSQSTVA